MNKISLLSLLLSIFLSCPVFTYSQVVLTTADNGTKTLTTASGGSFSLLRGTGSITSLPVSSSQTGSTYFVTASFPGSPAIASVASNGSSGGAFTLQITNNTGSNITNLTLNGTVFAFKDNSGANYVETLVASGVTGASNWNLSVTSDGNTNSTPYNPPNVTSLSATLTGYTFVNGSTITITWTDANDSGTDAMIGLGAASLTWGAPPAPIELTKFDATRANNNALLSFSTATELNNAYFAVERSGDGRTFEQIGEVKGAGNSTTEQYYTFTDVHPLKGINYYRLKQVDFDGSFTYSSVVSVQFDKVNTVVIYPTPATETVNVRLEESLAMDAKWQIVDMTGRVLSEGVFAAEQVQYSLHVVNLTQGAYVLRMIADQVVLTQQFRKL